MPRSDAEQAWRLVVEMVMETRGEWRRQVAAATGLPFSRVRALWRLEDGPRTQAELAHDMGTDAPATTLIVTALETRGLVKRTPDPNDRRAKQVSLTAAGRKMLATVAAITDRPPDAFAQLSREELKALRATLEKLAPSR
ncbi:MAG: MarR family transcriptional regulator [Proteobacteria bacterium]|nr:MarR family transcriptional regulator [Pseudomonadota bacterium]